MSEVCIIIPAFNAEAFIPGLIEALKAQTYSDWTAYISDDCSTDNTASLARRLSADDKRFVCVSSQSNSGGPFIPRSIAVALAESPFCCLIDADDDIEPDYLQALIDRQKATGATIVFPDMRDGLESVTRIPMDRIYEGRHLVAHTCYRWDIGCNGALYESALLRSVYLESIPSLWANISSSPLPRFVDEVATRLLIQKAPRVAFAGNAVYRYRRNESSISQPCTPRSFGFLLNDRLMALWASMTNDLIPETRERIAQQVFYGLVEKMKLLRLADGVWPQETVDECRRLTEDCYEALDFRAIRPHVGLPLYCIMRLGFRHAMKLLCLHGRNGWRPHRFDHLHPIPKE